MQVVILCGGMGTRLMPLTLNVPKPMVVVCGKPFLEHQIVMLKSFGLTDILILASYLGDQIETYFGNGTNLGVNIKYAYEKTPMGTGGALKLAESKLNESFMLLNGDTLLPINYDCLVNSFNEGNSMGLIVAYNNQHKIAPNNLKVSDGDEVLSYNKKDAAEMNYIDAGAIVLKKDVLDLIPEGGKCSLENEIFHQLIANRQLRAFKSDKRFYDMGSMEGLKTIEEVLV